MLKKCLSKIRLNSDIRIDHLVIGLLVITSFGHWSLVIGHWLLVIGYWLLVIGHRLLDENLMY